MRLSVDAASSAINEQHAIPALTTYELNGYGANLEHALQTMPEHDTVLPLLRDRLDEVITEQKERRRRAGRHRARHGRMRAVRMTTWNESESERDARRERARNAIALAGIKMCTCGFATDSAPLWGGPPVHLPQAGR